MSRNNSVSLNLFIVGFVSSSIQLLLLREILNISGGYELITGTFLATWLFVSSAGAALAGRLKATGIKQVNMLFAISPILSITLLIFVTSLFLDTGETPSFIFNLIYTLIVLLPFCLSSGFIFVTLTLTALIKNDFKPGNSFSIETIGGIIAGIIITILTSGILVTYQILLLIIVLHFSYVIVIFYIKKITTRAALIFVTFLLSLGIVIFHPDTFFRQLIMSGVHISNSIDTPYGNITTGLSGGDKIIFYNQRLVSYKNDEIEREENIHYSMLQSKKPGSVLLISGGLKTHLSEILKYHVNEVVYVERDPVLIGLEDNMDISTEKTKISIENDDAFRYIKSNDKKFDVIILLLPPPSTISLSRYYSTYFFERIKEKLNTGGVFTCSPGPGADYYNDESMVLNSSIFNSLKNSFANIEPIIGNKIFYLASDSLIDLSICRLIEEKGIKNSYVTSNYLSDDLIKIKSDEFKLLIDKKIEQNSLIKPVTYFQYFKISISKDNTNKIVVIILLSVLFITPLIFLKRKNTIMYISAAALAGTEIIILVIIQLTIGNIYHLTGLIIASLMAGLATGTVTPEKSISDKKYNIEALLLVLIYLITGLFISSIISFKSESLLLLFSMIISFITAFLTGRIYRSLSYNTIIYSDIAGIYSSDLAGSAFGFIFVTGLLLPLTGIQVTLFVLSAIIFASMVFGTLANK